MDDAALIRMANDIARNLAARGEGEAIAATAQHIRDFWDPRMIAAIRTAANAGLSPIALAAVQRLGGADSRLGAQ
jgi:formate dehydrogenase subunit delta